MIPKSTLGRRPAHSGDSQEHRLLIYGKGPNHMVPIYPFLLCRINRSTASFLVRKYFSFSGIKRGSLSTISDITPKFIHHDSLMPLDMYRHIQFFSIIGSAAQVSSMAM